MLELRAKLRFAMRNVRSTLSMVACLGIAIGGVTFLFALVNAVRFAPLPYPASDQLFYVSSHVGTGVWRRGISFPEARDLLSRSVSTDAFAIGETAHRSVSFGGVSEEVTGSVTTGDFFRVFRVPAMLGRTFTPSDPTGSVVVLSAKLWRRLFAGDSTIVGKVVRIDSTMRTVIGVMPPRFDFPIVSEFWIPIERSYEDSLGRGVCCFFAVGRLRATADLRRAAAEIANRAAGLRSAYPKEDRTFEAMPKPLRDYMVTAQTVESTNIAYALIGLLILLSGVTTASMLVKRDLQRMPTLAVLAALGSGRQRLVAGCVIESGILTLISGGVGLSVALVATGVVARNGEASAPSWVQVEIDWRVLAAGIASAVLIAAIAATPSVFAMSRANLGSLLSGSRTHLLRNRRFSGSLVSAQIAIAIATLVLSASVVRQTVEQARRKVGFRTRDVVRSQLSVRSEGRSGEKLHAVLLDDLARARQASSIFDAGSLELRSIGMLNAVRAPDAQTTLKFGDIFDEPKVGSCDPALFRVLDISPTSGRLFSWSEMTMRRPVAVLSTRAARELFGMNDPVGRDVLIDSLPTGSVRVSVIGVIPDMNLTPYVSSTPSALVLSPALIGIGSVGFLFVRTKGATPDIVSLISRQIGLGSPGTSVETIALTDWRASDIRQSAQPLSLYGPITAFALLVTVLGVVSLVEQEASERAYELAIRTALGATPRDNGFFLAGRIFTWLVYGVVLGVPATTIAVPIAESWHRGMNGVTGGVVTAVILAVVAMCCLAAVGPIRRTLRMGPMELLRTT